MKRDGFSFSEHLRVLGRDGQAAITRLEMALDVSSLPHLRPPVRGGSSAQA